jgi:hypothetical protein
MAQRYGGAHSPKTDDSPTRDGAPANRFRGRKTYQSDIRVKLLFIAPLPLLFSAIGELRAGDAFGMAAELLALAALLFAAYLLRDGIKAQAAFEARTIARPPKIPRKLFAAELTGVGVMLATFFGWNLGLIPALVFGTLASAAHIISFGLDPMRKKGMEGVNAFDAERVAKAVDKAEALVRETLSAAKRIGDRRLEGRVESLASAARDMFRAVEDDPRDLSSARKFLSVYLRGARDATLKFADLYAKTKDAKARGDYEALLGDLETSFTQQRKTMLLENRSDLDVEIEVLRDRLKQEGLRAGDRDLGE